MTRPAQIPQGPHAPLSPPVAEYLLRLAKQRLAGRAAKRANSVLWSSLFRLPGTEDDLQIEVLPSPLVLRIRNRVTGEVLAQTEPVEFGPLAPAGVTLAERFERWCEERRAGAETVTPAAGDPATNAQATDADKPPADGGAA